MDNFYGTKRTWPGDVPVVPAKKTNTTEEFLVKSEQQKVASWDMPYYKELDFYNCSEAYKLSELSVRKHWNNGSFNIHWSKQNPRTRDGLALPNSHQSIPATDLVEFIRKLEVILDEIEQSSYKVELKRFVGNKFARIKNRLDPNYFHESIVDHLDNSDIIFRPCKDFRGVWSVKLLIPRQSEANPNWIGVSCNLEKKACKEFVEVLKKIEKEIDAVMTNANWEETRNVGMDTVC